MKAYPFDERRLIALPGDEEASLTFAVEHFISVAQNAIELRGRFTVALSGGSTPKKIFQKLASPLYADAIEWSSVHVFWSDERSVLPTSLESNYKMAMDNGFSSLPVPKEQIHRMHAEENIEKGAKAYEELIRETLSGKHFDLIMLGMGDDGHTASLFPGTKALGETNKLVVPNYVEQKETYRMTMTFPCINAARHIVLYVLGENKRDRLAKVLLDKKDSFPSAVVGTKEHPALWVVDEQASKQLLEHWTPDKEQEIA